MQGLSKILMRSGYALALLPLLVDLLMNHFDVTQFFNESKGGAVLWIEVLALPLGLLFVLGGFLLKILSRNPPKFK
jgi:hypothetical protein